METFERKFRLLRDGNYPHKTSWQRKFDEQGSVKFRVGVRASCEDICAQDLQEALLACAKSGKVIAELHLHSASSFSAFNSCERLWEFFYPLTIAGVIGEAKVRWVGRNVKCVVELFPVDAALRDRRAPVMFHQTLMSLTNTTLFQGNKVSK